MSKHKNGKLLKEETEVVSDEEMEKSELDYLLKRIKEEDDSNERVSDGLSSQHKNDQHMEVKKETETKSTKCEECDKIFHSEHTLKDHIIVYHTQEYQHICDRCGKGFVHKRRLEKHRGKCGSENVFRPRKRRTSDGPKVTIAERLCNECGKSFKKLDALNRHMMHHTKSKHFQCDDCGKAYADKRNLKNHVEKEHPMSAHKFEREKNIPCNICDQLFAMKSEVEHHKVMDHNHSYFIKCDACGKGFIKKDYLKKLENHKKTCTEQLNHSVDLSL